MRRRGRWFGWGGGMGCGPGYGGGNPYPYCRRYPWMPRGWWAYGFGPRNPYRRGEPNDYVVYPGYPLH
jgi:hypothetical protein